MKIGIIGLPGAGSKTVFEAITKGKPYSVSKNGSRMATVKVPDKRCDILTNMFKPKKTTYAAVEYFSPPSAATSGEQGDVEKLWQHVRGCDALIEVVRNFHNNGHNRENPDADAAKLIREMVFADYQVIEKRIERIECEAGKKRKIDEHELEMLKRALGLLEKDRPVSEETELAGSPLLKGYGLVSAKPLLILVNNNDEDDIVPEQISRPALGDVMVIKGRIESELAGMSEDEAREFAVEFGIGSSALDRVIERSYKLLGLISFFTVGEDEVKAWTVKSGAAAVDAAEVIHSDIKKGFIRAEVVAYKDLIESGSYKEARNLGKVRLEGKEYIVQDGDIISFRFNV